jgi:hypothetical protein
MPYSSGTENTMTEGLDGRNMPHSSQYSDFDLSFMQYPRDPNQIKIGGQGAVLIPVPDRSNSDFTKPKRLRPSKHFNYENCSD